MKIQMFYFKRWERSDKYFLEAGNNHKNTIHKYILSEITG